MGNQVGSYAYIGSWEVVTYGNLYGPKAEKGLNGIRFRLDETGDVIWTVPDDLKGIPLFWCDTYEVDKNVLRFGAYSGQVIGFSVEPRVPTDTLVMRCEGWCIMKCKRVENEAPENDPTVPFVLLRALEDGYFTDVTITSSNNKKFEVHTCILHMLAPDIPWESDPPPFTGFREEVIGIILHYLYTECLPNNSLDRPTVEEVINAACLFPCLLKLVETCRAYLKNLALKKQIIEIINDVHLKIDQITDRFVRNPESRRLVCNPEEFSFVLNQTIRDIAVVFAELLVLCDTFARRRSELTTDERNEIIRYAHSRVPTFLLQGQKLLDVLKETFDRLTLAECSEIATYMLYDVESVLKLLVGFVVEANTKLALIITTLESKSKESVCSKSDVISKPLKYVLHKKEISKLADIHSQIKKAVIEYNDLKNAFSDWGEREKVTTIRRNFEILIDQLFATSHDYNKYTKTRLKENFDWRVFKYSLKLFTSEVSGVLQQLVTHKTLLGTFIQDICNVVKRDAFTQCFVTLGFVEASEFLVPDSTQKDVRLYTPTPTHQSNVKLILNLSESFCLPPSPTKSNLAKMGLRLLSSEYKADMEFDVVNLVFDSETGQTQETAKIAAHRVIVASRCEVFKKALMSGMRETVEKKIAVHDTNPYIFKIFLEYLYSGILQPKHLNNEQLSELLLLSDRYEFDSLKLGCEYALQSNIDTDNVVYLFSIADQCNAKILRESCIIYISRHHKSIDSELYFELPAGLQVEVLHNTCTTPPKRKLSLSDRPASDPVDPVELSALQEGLSNLHFSQSQSTGNSLEDLTVRHDTARLNECISQLCDIIGNSASRETLEQIVLAADYDLCRAINYFFTNDGEGE